MRRTAKILAAVAIVLATVAGRARAQDTTDATTTRSDGTRVTEYTFEASSVHADPVGPDGAVVMGARRHRRDTLVHPRAHYIDRLLESVDAF